MKGEYSCVPWIQMAFLSIPQLLIQGFRFRNELNFQIVFITNSFNHSIDVFWKSDELVLAFRRINWFIVRQISIGFECIINSEPILCQPFPTRNKELIISEIKFLKTTQLLIIIN